MNGVCAGGTGSFIDQMAALLQTDAAGLNTQAAQYKEIYPIAARCGVFAKSDIQPLINEGRPQPTWPLPFSGGCQSDHLRTGLRKADPRMRRFSRRPAALLPELKKAFIRTLHLTPENVVDPEDSHLFAAMGAALEADDASPVALEELIRKTEKGVAMDFEIKRLSPCLKAGRTTTPSAKDTGRPLYRRRRLRSTAAIAFSASTPVPPPPSSRSSAATASCCTPTMPTTKAAPSKRQWKPSARCTDGFPMGRRSFVPAPRATGGPAQIRILPGRGRGRNDCPLHGGHLF